MRLFFLVVTFLDLSVAYCQSRPDCVLPLNCVTLLNDGSIKSLKSKTQFVGKIIVQASLDTTSLTLTNLKIIYGDLYSKKNPEYKIQYRYSDMKGNSLYFDNFLPEIKKHLTYLKFKIVGQNCIMPTDWKFPITLR